jgi:hypothetical protein
VGLAAGLLLSACSSDNKDNETSTAGNNEATSDTKAAESTTTSSSTSTTTTTLDTSKDDELAKQALLATSDLPAGSWTKSEDTSSDDSSVKLLDIPSCKVLAGDATAAAAKPTGKASAEFAQGDQDEVFLGNDVELYASKDTLKEVKTMTNSADFGTCFTDFIKKQMTSGADGGDMTFDEIKVSAFNIGVSSDDVGVDFLTGIRFTFSSEIGGAVATGDFRGVFIGVDRGLSTVSIGGISVPDLGLVTDIDSVDLKPTVKAAGKNLVSVLRTN